ncbi:MAG: ImmA/IrrE family metallo-endopeptidase [Firmicutes bacterium]|nr:ImmA/IrrE family metallo-endopeptidase [Bacillota bacterium]
MSADLFNLAEKEGILVDFYYLPCDILGAYYHAKNKPPVILLHKNIKHHRRLLRCIFAEELGHHFKSVYGNNYLFFARAGKYLAAKYEKLAIFWAVEYLMPLDRLAEAVNSGLFLTHEIAEFFDVTELFAGTGIKLYFEKRRDYMVKLLKKLPEELQI